MINSIFSSHRVGARIDTLLGDDEEQAAPPKPMHTPPVEPDPLPAQDQSARDAGLENQAEEELQRRLAAARRNRQIGVFQRLLEPMHLWGKQMQGMLERYDRENNGIWRLTPFHGWGVAYDECIKQQTVDPDVIEFIEARPKQEQHDESVRIASLFMENYLLAVFEMMRGHLTQCTSIHIAQLMRNATTRAKLAQWGTILATVKRHQYSKDNSKFERILAEKTLQALMVYFRKLTRVTDNALM